jgi:mannosyltransferase
MCQLNINGLKLTTTFQIVTHEPPQPLRRVEGDNYDYRNEHSSRTNATLLALVRNSELDEMISSMRDLERTFNRKFNYPWLFLNDVPFTEEFIKKIRAETKAQVTFGMAYWSLLNKNTNLV